MELNHDFAENRAVQSTYTLNYNPNSAIAYAKMYSEFDQNGHLITNSVFPYWDEDGKTNCTNFASQCVWAGFGGNSSSGSLNSYTYPMHQSTAGGSNLYNGWNLTNTSVYSALGAEPCLFGNMHYCRMVTTPMAIRRQRPDG